MEHSNTFESARGTIIDIKVKTECSTKEDMREALGFIAQSSHKFYLETAEKINNMLPAQNKACSLS